MSEEKAKYLDGVSEDRENQILDEAAPRDYFAQIPNIVDLMELSPHAYRLYGRLRRVAGESGRCWQSTKTLAKVCNMSAGKVSESKHELENVYPPLIRIESRKFDRGTYHEITITDIWEINHAFFTGGEVTIKTANGWAFHNMNGWRSQYEQDRSPGETKKNPVQEEPERDYKDEAGEISGRLAILVKLYWDNLGAPNPLMADILRNAAIDYPNEAWYQPAFEAAVKANARSWNYVAAVLKGWQDHGFGWKPESVHKKSGRAKPSPESTAEEYPTINP